MGGNLEDCVIAIDVLQLSRENFYEYFFGVSEVRLSVLTNKGGLYSVNN